MRAAVAAALLAGAAFLLVGASSSGQAVPNQAAKGIAKHRIGTFDAPMYLTHAPGAPNFLYVVERAGRIEVMKNGHHRGTSRYTRMEYDAGTVPSGSSRK